MLDPETAALLRAVLDELCASTSPSDMCTRTNVASKLLEAASQEVDASGGVPIDASEAASKEHLLQTPTMWP